MVKIYLYATFPLIPLLWLTVRALAEIAAEFIRKEDMFVNHGLRNVTTASVLQCCVVCSMNDSCLSVSYNTANKICQVNDRNPTFDENAATTSSVGWTSFYLADPCRSGWYLYRGSCYKVVTIDQTWTSSESHCQTLGGHLADIQNADEDQFVHDLAYNVSANYWYWIGLNDREEEGTYLWSSSAPNQFLANLYHHNEESGHSNCSYLQTPYVSWFINKCGYVIYSICKAEK